jgi:hypothetical protein
MKITIFSLFILLFLIIIEVLQKRIKIQNTNFFFNSPKLFNNKQFALSSLIVLFFIILTQSAYLNFETIDWDINSYLVASQDVLRGNLPYLEQWESKQVLFYYLYAIILKASFGNLIVFKFLNDLILFFITFVLFLIIQNISNNSYKALIGALFFVIIMAQPWATAEFSELYSLLFIAYSYYLILIKDLNRKITLVAGSLLAISSLVNIGASLFLLPIGFHILISKRELILSFSFPPIFLHLFFTFIYYLENELEVYLSTLFFIPNAYSGESMNFISSFIDFLRSLFGFNNWLFVGILVLIFVSIMNVFNLKNKEEILIFFKSLHIQFIFVSLLFYYLASHGYYHHLIFFIFFIPTLIVYIKSKFHTYLFFLVVLLGLATVTLKSTNTAFNNLRDIEKIYDNYPLKVLSYEIDSIFEKEYSILAFDSILVLYYLDKPNFSYVIHPSNHTEEFIYSNLIKIKKIQYNEPSRLVDMEPDVIICSNNQIIQCEIYDYKQNYYEYDSLRFRQNPNLQFYDNQSFNFRVFIKES